MNTTTTTRKCDLDIQHEVVRELMWEPRLGGSDVGVQVKHGVVTLVGPIDSWAKKQAACDAAHRVPGVLDVANDLTVVIPTPWKRTDSQIAEAVRHALQWNTFVPSDRVLSTVMDGWVTLQGQVDSGFQHEEVTRSVERIAGVRGVMNKVVVRANPVDAAQIRSSIQQALVRQTEREVKRIDVRVQDGVVTLSGMVRSWSEKVAIERLASHERGVHRVQNDLAVDPHI
ncbi:MAG: BON domain-containing protein [Planctomycetota bacterium]|nr:BON domain-containing protein [Planctomycetota bacterium]